MASINEHESAQIDRANASGKTPVMFIHGLWLLPSSWDNWAKVFEEAGYTALTPGWPDDPETVGEAKQHRGVHARPSARSPTTSRTSRASSTGAGRDRTSFGGLLAQILAGRGVAKATVAIDPAPFRGVLPLPVSALKAASPALGNRRTATARCRSRTSSSATRSRTPWKRTKRSRSTTYCVPASGAPIFQAAAANLNRGPR